jgi:tRNA1Val (adenine37-N6)-methyltransferase
METDQRKSEVLCDLQRNGLKILQSPEHFCFGIDAVLLSAYAAEHIQPGSRVLDLGTGTGIIPILLSARTKAAQLTGLEIQAECAEMARRSVQLNDLGDRVEIVTGDLKDVPSLYAKGSFDAVTCNPPYMPAGAGLKNPAGPLAIARHEVLCSFGDIAAAAAHVLKPGGHLCLVHRPFRLPELFETLKDHRLEPKEMQLVVPRDGKAANIVLIHGVKGAGPELHMLPQIAVHTADGGYTEEILRYYERGV